MTTKLASSTIEAMLGDLLAVIHRDGGHRQDAVGTEQAWMEAMMTVPFLLEAKDAALTPGAGYAAGIEDAAKVALDFREADRAIVNETANRIATAIRSLKPASLPQPAPAEDALRSALQTAVDAATVWQDGGDIAATMAFEQWLPLARQALTGTKGDAVKVWPSGTVRLTKEDG